jgi:hypothetical protein
MALVHILQVEVYFEAGPRLSGNVRGELRGSSETFNSYLGEQKLQLICFFFDDLAHRTTLAVP